MRKKSTFIALLISFVMIFSFTEQHLVMAYVINKDELVKPKEKDIIQDTLLNWVVRCLINRKPEYVQLTKDSLKGLEEVYYSEGDHYDLYEFNVFVKNIEGLQYATDAKRILLPYNEISDLTPLSNLTNVNKIILNDNFISDITPLSNLTKMKIINLLDNKITSLEPLSKMTELESLNVGFNKISNTKVLSNFPKLKYVNLTHNNIKDISSLKNLKEVETLLLGNNKIKDISSITNMTKLKELEITSTEISDISCLKNLRNLEILRLSNNPNIKDISPLTNLTKLNEKELWLGNTAIADQKDNLFRVIKVNKKINKFKANYISIEDKNDVKEARKAFDSLSPELKKYIPELRITAAEENITRLEKGEDKKVYPELAEFDKQPIEKDINLKVLTAKVEDKKGHAIKNVKFNLENSFGDILRTIKSNDQGIIKYNLMQWDSYMKYKITFADKEKYITDMENITFETNGKSEICKINGKVATGEEKIKFIITENK